MGGKTAQSTSQVTIPPEVLARYNSVNATAQQAAENPFQIYSTDPNAFVAAVNPEQSAGIGAVNNAAQSWLPYWSNANTDINNATQTGGLGTQAAYAPLNQGNSYANSFQGTASGLTGLALNQAQPFNSTATGLALAGTQAVDPSQLNINQYLSPYLNTVLAGTLNPMIQQQQQQQSALQGNQIANGAFGGDRAGIDAAVLAQQQNLALGQAAAGILQPVYDTALATAQQQQGVGLGAAQANRAAIQQAAPELAAIGQQQYGQTANTAQQFAGLGQQYFGQGVSMSQQQAALAQQMFAQGATAAQVQAALGTGAQTAGLTGAQAQIGAGTLEQQTSQAGLTALYNQFQQQQGYPFQVAQFLANIAEGTGALSGSTTTSTQPVMGFFSDERLKEDIEPIGKTFDGQNIIKFRYKGEKAHRIGLSAQETEKKHPDAVGLAGGYRYVDYDKATEDSAHRGHFHSGGGTVGPEDAYQAYAAGGMPGFDLGSILQAQQGMYSTFKPGGGGLGGYGASIPNTPSAAKLTTANAPTIKTQNPVDTLKDMNSAIDAGSKLYKTGQKWVGPSATSQPTGGLAPANDSTPDADVLSGVNPVDTSGAGLDAEGTPLTSFDDFSGFADGGATAPDDGTYPLSNTYANYLAQQKAHPFTGSGLYGNPLITAGVGGPYTTMLEGPNPALHILQVDAPRPTPYKEKDISDASSAQLAKENAGRKKPSGLSIDAQARGGRLGRDSGGYVPDNDNEQHPGLAVATPPPPPKDNTMNDIGDLAKVAATVAMMANRGGRAARAGGGLIASDPSMSMPYGGSGYVPEQQRTAISLNPPSAGGGQGGGGSGIGQLGQLANIGLGIAALFNKGGRAGYDDGGSVDMDLPPDVTRGSNGPPRVLDTEERVAKPYVIPHRSYAPTLDDTPSSFGERPLLPADVQAHPAQITDTTPAGLSPAAVGTPDAPTPSLPDRSLGQRLGDTASDVADDVGGGLSNAYKWVRGAPLGAPGATPTSGSDSDFMSRNQSWLVPLLKGIGASTLYPGKSLFGALTYGAMEGAESYEDIQNQMQERNATGMDIQRQQAEIAHNAMVPGMGGVNVYMPDGSIQNISLDQYRANPGAYRLAPGGKQAINPYAPMANTAAPQAGTPAYFQQKYPNTSRQMAQAGDGSTPDALTQDDLGVIDRNVHGMITTPHAFDNPGGAFANQPNMVQGGEAIKAGNAAAQVAPLMRQLSEAVAEQARGGRGGEVSTAITNFGQGVLGFARSLQGAGVPGADAVVAQLEQHMKGPLSPGAAGVQQEIIKLSQTLSGMAAAAGDQRSAAALEDFTHQYPSHMNTPEGARKLIATVLTANQQSQDEGRYAQNWINAAAEGAGNNRALAGYATDGLRQRFTDTRTAQYGTDRTQLERMATDLTPRKDMSVLEYLVRNGASLTPQQKQYIVSRYGRQTLRYFGVQ